MKIFLSHNLVQSLSGIFQGTAKRALLHYFIHSVSLLIIISIFSFWGLYPKSAWGDSQIIPGTTLRSASELSYPPFAIVQPDGTAGGFSVELLEAAAVASGISVTFKVGPWQELKEDLAAGRLDVLPLVSYSEERDRIYDFSAPYLRMNCTVFVRDDNTEIKQVADLKDKEVLVMLGDTAHEYVVREKLSDKIITTTSYEIAFQKLASGKHDAVVVQQIVGLQLLKQLNIDNIVPVEVIAETTLKPITLQLKGFEQKFCFAVQEGNGNLLSLLNEGLAALYLNGTYEALYEKWFSPILPQPKVSFAELTKHLLVIIIPLLLVIAITGMWYFRRRLHSKTEHLRQEINQRVKIEKELQEANSNFAKAQAIGKVGNWRYSVTTDQLTMSEETRQIFGFNGDAEDISLTLADLESCIVNSEISHQALLQLIDNGTPYNLECLIRNRATGTLRTVICMAEPEINDISEVIRVNCVVQDITEKKKLEDHLQQAQKLESIGVLAGGIAHDFNNILSAIIGFTELAKESNPTNLQLQEDLTEIYTAGLRAKELVQQILSFSRKTPHAFIPVHAASIVSETVKLLRASFPANITIELELNDDNTLIMADPTNIHQIVMNICTNAAHAMAEKGGILSVKASEITPDSTFIFAHPQLTNERYLRLHFADTGSGITPETIGKIFDPYFTTKNLGDGTGLGLSVTHGLVTNMGGAIEVESEVGKGTIFTIFLPVVPGKDLPSVEKIDLPGGIKAENQRILVVDDEEAILKLTKRMLERHGYIVTTEINGLNALKKIRSEPFAYGLIICDMDMPAITGDLLARSIMEIRPDIPIICVSGYHKKITAGNMQQFGIKALLQKPVTEHQLVEKVCQVIADSQ